MKKFKSCKRLLSFVLCLCMVLSMMPNLTVSAATEIDACYANRLSVKISVGNQTKFLDPIEGLDAKKQSATVYIDADTSNELLIEYSQPSTANPVIGKFRDFEEPRFNEEIPYGYMSSSLDITSQFKADNAASGYARLYIKANTYGNYPLSIKLGGSIGNGAFIGTYREITLNIIAKKEGKVESNMTYTVAPGHKTFTPSLTYKADRYTYSWTKKGSDTVLSTNSSYSTNCVNGEEYICTIKGKDLTSTIGCTGTTQSWTHTYKVTGYDLTPPTPIEGLVYTGKQQKLFTPGSVSGDYYIGFRYNTNEMYPNGYQGIWNMYPNLFINVGTYTFTYYVLIGPFPDATTVYTQRITCRIDPAPVDIVWPTFKTITLGDKLTTSHLVGGSATFNGNQVAGSFSISGNTNWSYGGEKTVTVTFTPSDKNFKSSSKELKVNVTCTHPDSQISYAYNDDSTHSKMCSCGWTSNVPHNESVKANCLEVAYCDVCKHTYGSVNPNNHTSNDTTCKFIDEDTHGIYYNCCGALKVAQNHTLDQIATCTEQKHCSVCKSTFGEINGSNHVGKLEWVIDNYQHIKKWTCCGATEGVLETHTPDFKVSENGEVLSADCSVCDHHLGEYSISFEDGVVYDGKEHRATKNGYIYCAYGNKTIHFTYWQNGERVDKKYDGSITKAGTYTVRLGTYDQSDYIEKEVTINKRELTIDSVKVRDKSYDGNNEVTAYGAYFNNVVEGEDVACGIYGTVVVNGNTVGEYKTVTGIESVRPFVSYIESYAGDNYYVTVDPKIEYPIANGGCNIYERTLTVTAHNQSIIDGEEIDQTAYTIENLPEGYEISGIKLETNEYNNVIDVNPYDAVITLNGEDVTENFDYSIYTGILEVVCKNHSFDSDGFCLTRECNVYQTPKFTLDDMEQVTYTITNAGELYFYANQVNTYGLSSTSAILANDIVIPDTVSQGGNIPDWTPINNLYADFDGNGYSISGLYVDSDSDYVGLFGNHGYYNVKNLTIKDSYFKGNQYVGAIAGYSEGNYKNCAVTDDVTVIGTNYVGGMIGENLGFVKINNCMSLATVEGSLFTGGLVGYNYTNINNCYTNSDKLVGSHNNYYGCEITNSYYLADVETDELDGTTAVSSDDFKSGKLAYILQEKVLGEEIYDEDLDEWVTLDPAQVWGQNLGVDEYPMISNYKVFYGYKDCMATKKIYDNFPLSNDMIGHTHVWGDVDFDNRLTVRDATEIAKYLAGMVRFNYCQLTLADANADGIVNINDVTYIQMKLADLV